MDKNRIQELAGLCKVKRHNQWELGFDYFQFAELIMEEQKNTLIEYVAKLFEEQDKKIAAALASAGKPDLSQAMYKGKKLADMSREELYKMFDEMNSTPAKKYRNMEASYAQREEIGLK